MTPRAVCRQHEVRTSEPLQSLGAESADLADGATSANHRVSHHEQLKRVDHLSSSSHEVSAALQRAGGGEDVLSIINASHSPACVSRHCPASNGEMARQNETRAQTYPSRATPVEERAGVGRVDDEKDARPGRRRPCQHDCVSAAFAHEPHWNLLTNQLAIELHSAATLC